jgi:hypothetical protein
MKSIYSNGEIMFTALIEVEDNVAATDEHLMVLSGYLAMYARNAQPRRGGSKDGGLLRCTPTTLPMIFCTARWYFAAVSGRIRSCFLKTIFVVQEFDNYFILVSMHVQYMIF